MTEKETTEQKNLFTAKVKSYGNYAKTYLKDGRVVWLLIEESKNE